MLILTKRMNAKKGGIAIGILAAACLLYQIPAVASLFSMVTVPMVTFLVVGLLCLFNVGIMKTRIGQQFRAVGQNRTVANASGIHVDHVRVIAIMISTVLAGWGQLIFVQNMGTFQTYGAHEQVGLYAGAAILVGGASIRRATNSQALLGCVLFHLLFIVTPPAAKNLFGDAAIGEYFRVFISYGVIALALVMHAWSSIQRTPETPLPREPGRKTEPPALSGRPRLRGRLSLSKKLACGDLFRQNAFPLRFQRGRGNVQGNLAAQGFRIHRTCHWIRNTARRAAALRTSLKGFLTVWGGMAFAMPPFFMQAAKRADASFSTRRPFWIAYESVLALACSLSLLFTFHAGLFIMLTLASLCQNTCASTLTFEPLQSAFQGFILADAYLGHCYPSPRSYAWPLYCIKGIGRPYIYYSAYPSSRQP